MGNRAVITTADNLNNGVGLEKRTDKVGIYLHWNGGLDSVIAFLTYAKMQGIRSPIEDNYGWARLCQIISNYFTEDDRRYLSIGIDTLNNIDCDNGDNGVYCINEQWDIVERIYFAGQERDDHGLMDMLNDIDIHQPQNMQLGNQAILDWLANNEPSKVINEDAEMVEDALKELDPSKTREVKELSTSYFARGYVFGKCWGSGTGSYPARRYSNNNKKALIEEINKDFESGALDSGFGFESLLAAEMEITTVSSVEIDGKEYTNESTENITLGEDKHIEILAEMIH